MNREWETEMENDSEDFTGNDQICIRPKSKSFYFVELNKVKISPKSLLRLAFR